MKFKSIAVEINGAGSYDTRDGDTKTYYETRLIAVDSEGDLWYTDDNGENWHQYEIGVLHPVKNEG